MLGPDVEGVGGCFPALIACCARAAKAVAEPVIICVICDMVSVTLGSAAMDCMWSCHRSRYCFASWSRSG
ncbi:MAG: hypothetical protein ABJI62_09165 [Alphaproteobacteria bacterium]